MKSTQKPKVWYWLIPAVLVFIAGFAVASFYDLSINQAVSGSPNVFTVIMEVVGWYPAFLPAILLFVLLFMRYGSVPRSLGGKMKPPALLGLVVIPGFAAVYYMAWHYLAGRVSPEAGTGFWVVMAGAAAAFAVASVLLVLKYAKPIQDKLMVFALFGSAYMLANQIVVYTLKTIWQRTRFDDMLASGSFVDFTPWFQPFGNGGSSFPSGHTANAAGIFMLIILCDLFAGWNKRRKLIYILCWGYIAVMAVARIWIGRHFLADTLAAAALMAVVFFLLRRTKVYKRALQKQGWEAEEGKI